MDPTKIEKKSTTGSAIGLVLVGLAIVAVVGIFVVFPEALESLLMVAVVVLIAIAVIAVGIALFAGVIAVPMYAKKGEIYQTDMSYSVDDVEEVKGTVDDDHRAH